ncbi:hypothetical protein VOLCADRAFT_94896 [Volvox carteri f. nagariensis]|uniref:EGF-like domain-containing protein n=1 Tax=Volvox carteri f. nagariensis TaxID=3068 RepID=D8U624_VOLCA|nr:uncharacterized protein VOLCADRAFT_94896 [Volvox carteri f. nagariensis]EFJ44864.1 hypothetical protein VOLCADRAFT_94896 [Volvox carteri f. nagariensis]|eukprot:XP_002954147.1 hypothetical protein VOLCADRAFT_94896 [Volvox carteri f. nagariensis]
MCYSCLVLITLQLLAQSGPTIATALSFTSCEPKCFDHGTCNPETQRCECPLLWHGFDCSIPFSQPKEQCATYSHSLLSCGSRDQTQCLNSCHGRGWCEGGFCHCHPGHYGADCALSLGPDGRPELLSWQGYTPRQHGVKIYVYELPPLTNTW